MGSRKQYSFMALIIISILLLVSVSGCKKGDSGKAGVYDMSGVTAPDKVKTVITNDILKWIANSSIIEEVKNANAKNASRTIDQIKKTDDEWIKAEKVNEFMTQFLTNKAALFIKDIVKNSGGKYSEIFIMDNQGCNVAMSSKTSDFWQGDEAKFKKSYNGGAGAVFADKVKYDESTKTSSMQVSLPVVDPATKKVIGAITIGIDIDNL